MPSSLHGAATALGADATPVSPVLPGDVEIPDKVKNVRLWLLRRSRRSPGRRGRTVKDPCLSRREVAAGANAALERLYPGERVSQWRLTEHLIGRYERGEVDYPAEQRRAALRDFFGVRTDAELGFFEVGRVEPVIAAATGDLIPWVRGTARPDHRFVGHAVGRLARSGVRRFLDVGAGLPASLVRAVAPEAQVSSVAPDLVHTLDLSEPVAVVLAAVLHFVHDLDEALSVVRTLAGAVPVGSYVVISHATNDFAGAAEAALYERRYAAGQIDFRARTAGEIARFVEGLEVLDPGLVPVLQWRPDDESHPHEANLYGVVAKKTRPFCE